MMNTKENNDNFTELDRWVQFKDEVTAIFDFFDYLNSEGILLSKYNDTDNLTLLSPSELGKLVCESFGVNPIKLEQERQDLLELVKQ